METLFSKRVLVRADLNVPLLDGKILDETRLIAELPTLQELQREGACIILMSHLDRPSKPFDSHFSMKPVAQRLSELLGSPMQMAKDCIGESVENQAAALKPGEILLLENLRFYPAEEKPELDPTFAENLARLGEFYINDAFGTVHRKHSSTYILPKLFGKNASLGPLFAQEIEALRPLVENPKRPYVAIIGGAKIGTKLKLLKSLEQKVDHLLIGGRMAHTLLHIHHPNITDFEGDCLSQAEELLKSNKIILPQDLIGKNREILSLEDPIEQAFDIGPKTISLFDERIAAAQTIVWNGPLGVYEKEEFAQGTQEIAKAVARASAYTVCGGGDLLAALKQAKVAEKIDHLCTGGGAMLAYLEQGSWPTQI